MVVACSRHGIDPNRVCDGQGLEYQAFLPATD